MSTSPPPIAAPVEANAQASQPGLSEPQRIINTFIAPRKTFEDLKRNSSWWAPWVFGAVFSLLFGVVAVQKLDMTNVVQKQIEQSKMAQRQMEQMSPEQREQNIRVRASVTKVIFFLFPILSLITVLIIGAVLMAVFNFGFAAEIPFGRALAICFYSFLPAIVTALLMIVSLLVSSDLSGFNLNNPVATNLGFFMDPQGNKFLYAIASRIDAIQLWICALLGLGFATCSAKKLSAGTAIGTVLAVYGLYTLVVAGLAAAF